MNEIISGFIDDELSLSEKIRLVRRIRDDENFSAETLQLLDQETLLCAEMYDRTPVFHPQPAGLWKQATAWMFRPRSLATAAATALVALMLLWSFQRPAPVFHLKHPQRFVLYRPDASRVEIAGSFSEWQRIPLGKIGTTGYWEVTIALPTGEHRFTYIIEGRERIPDPTILLKEDDDFGGSNSVLRLENGV
jgi:hypothetical protein